MQHEAVFALKCSPKNFYTGSSCDEFGEEESDEEMKNLKDWRSELWRIPIQIKKMISAIHLLKFFCWKFSPKKLKLTTTTADSEGEKLTPAEMAANLANVGILQTVPTQSGHEDLFLLTAAKEKTLIHKFELLDESGEDPDVEAAIKESILPKRAPALVHLPI